MIPLLRKRVFGCIQCTTLCFPKCFLFFRTEHAQSTPLGLKLMSLVVLRDSVVAKAGVWVHTMHHFVLSKMFLVLLHRTCPMLSFSRNSCSRWFHVILLLRKWVLAMHTMHHFMLLKLFLVLSQRTCPIHSIRPKTHVLGGFVRFRCCECGCWVCIQWTTLCF